LVKRKSSSTLNEVFSALSARRRYEVWFLRMGLADGSGAWWFRYLLMNPGRGGCAGDSRGAPVQLWATWFPAGNKPQSFIQGFPLKGLEISGKEKAPFHFRIGGSGIEEESCRGAVDVHGHAISWNLRYGSTFHTTLSDKGWIGFSRTPHSDATVSGQITLDGRTWAGDPLGFGVQGHNCGYRHRNFWVWTHVYFPRASGTASTLEALVYEMPFGLVFRKAVLWHDAQKYVFRNLLEMDNARKDVRWKFRCTTRNGICLDVSIDGRGPSMHRLPYLKTDCTGSFEVINNSLASAAVGLQIPGRAAERLESATGAVLEIVG
jgi:hypothetical protein